MKCLLVDDEPGIREGLAMLLRRRGYEVHTAGDCSSAVAALEAEQFDVVVTDWRLPDGTAVTFAADCACPVLAVSGHPDEVCKTGAIRDAIAKPVRPNALLEKISSMVCVNEVDVEEASLSTDVQAVVDDLLSRLPAASDVSCEDDGTFVVLNLRLPGTVPQGLSPLGGDLSVRPLGDGCALELRLCRDGRPDPDMPARHVDGPWPAGDRFALDCEGTTLDRDAFDERCADVAAKNAAGGKICLLNVPDCLEPIRAAWEKALEVPMRAQVGPRLSAEMTELWS